MSRALTNKQLVVLALLREGGDWTCKMVAKTIRERTPCAHCNGTGEGDHEHYGCRHCYGHGKRHFDYSDAYVALDRLRKEGLVGRRCKRDEWGDELPLHVYFATAVPDPTDPLEQAFDAPAAEVNR